MLPDNPSSSTLSKGTEVELRLQGGRQIRQIAGVRRHKVFLLLSFAGIEDRSAAEALVGAELWVRVEQLPPLGEGEFYLHELRGMEVVTTSGERVGEVVDVWPAPAGDVLVVGCGGRESLVPMVDTFIKQVNRQTRQILIDPIPGLLGE